MLPLLFDFALTSSTLPAIIPKVSLGLSPIGTAALMGELFYEHPLVYTLIYIGINGLFPQEQWANQILTIERFISIFNITLSISDSCVLANK